MRVVAGRFKGRTLHAPFGRGTRPTSDKVREAIFSVLGDIEGFDVLDLFAGSGALGIEALSRGASAAVFVDTDEKAVAAIRRNLGAVGVEAPVQKRDALRYLSAADGRFELVFVDPPYSSAPRMGESLSRLLPAVLLKDALIVTESDKRAPLQLEFPLEFERDYGDTRIRIHRG
ncbi:MAG: 16S rRNA (guanine(966)-N(2))-methyltransferase RsmD [Thermoleophilaceae bacterium]